MPYRKHSFILLLFHSDYRLNIVIKVCTCVHLLIARYIVPLISDDRAGAPRESILIRLGRRVGLHFLVEHLRELILLSATELIQSEHTVKALIPERSGLWVGISLSRNQESHSFGPLRVFIFR